MKRVVAIPNVVVVAFPDHMSDEDVAKATANLHDKSITPPWHPGGPADDQFIAMLAPKIADLVRGVGSGEIEFSKALLDTQRGKDLMNFVRRAFPVSVSPAPAATPAPAPASPAPPENNQNAE